MLNDAVPENIKIPPQKALEFSGGGGSTSFVPISEWLEGKCMDIFSNHT